MSSLANVEKLRQVVTRLFTGTTHEVLSELFQNSQRAGASRVDIECTETGFTYTDNGEGITSLEGFRKLLAIAESDWDEQTIANQHPMGLGIQSLLCLPNAQTVTFHSGDLSITIDTKRWWADLEYAEKWEQLVEVVDPIKGFKITATGTFNIAEPFNKPLWSNHLTPAQGYEQFLQIWLNGELIDTTVPQRILPTTLIKTEYQGAKLIIGGKKETEIFSNAHLTVNWYGQLIQQEVQQPIGFYLEVQQGQPVTPMAPARRGIIKDEKWQALTAFVKEQVIQYFASGKGNNQPKLLLEVLRHLTAEERNRIPYTVASQWDTENHACNTDDWDETLPLKVVPKASLLCVNSIITIPEENDDRGALTQYDYPVGISTFVPLITEHYGTPFKSPSDGTFHNHLIPQKFLWWKPGAPITVNTNTTFCEGGHWGLSDSSAVEPTAWHPVGQAPVLAVAETSNWDCTDPTFFVANVTPETFYKEYAWAGFDPNNDDYTHDHIYAEYDATIEREYLRIIKAVPKNFKLSDLEPFTPSGIKVTNIQLGDNQIIVTFSNQETITIPQK